MVFPVRVSLCQHDSTASKKNLDNRPRSCEFARIIPLASQAQVSGVKKPKDCVDTRSGTKNGPKNGLP